MGNLKEKALMDKDLADKDFANKVFTSKNLAVRKAIGVDLPEILAIYERAREFMKFSGNETQWGDNYPGKDLLEGDIASGNLYVIVSGASSGDYGSASGNAFCEASGELAGANEAEGEMYGNDVLDVDYTGIVDGGDCEATVDAGCDCRVAPDGCGEADTTAGFEGAQGIDFEVCGVFALVIGDDPTYQEIQGSWHKNEPYGTIHRIAGDGKTGGVFAACIEFCCEQCDYLRIDTHENNKVMQHMVEKHGFSYCGIIYVEDGSERLAYDR